MKRLLIILFQLFLVSVCFAAFDYTPANNSQYVAGFINASSGEPYLIIEVYREMDDIDLNVHDENNNVRHQITPSSTGELGLKIGSFKLSASGKNFKLTVAHDRLFHSAQNNVSVEYKLGIRFWLQGSTVKEFSENSNNNNVAIVRELFTLSNEVDLHSIVIDFRDVIDAEEGIILISKENSGIYFRLSNELPTVDGNYSSNVYFVLEEL